MDGSCIAYEEGKKMVDELRLAVEQAQHQSDEVQRRIAQLIAEALEEQEWDQLVSTPESQAFLDELVAETRAAIAAGETEEGGWEL
jgi:polyhydroxyalkanoate synthesis regulator phasin